MTCLEAYIGLADDPNFKWEGGDWNGNIPKRISPVLPKPYEIGRNLPELVFVQLDWGARGAKIRKTQILELLQTLGSTDELSVCVQGLDDNTEYALIIAEFERVSVDVYVGYMDAPG